MTIPHKKSYSILLHFTQNLGCTIFVFTAEFQYIVLPTMVNNPITVSFDGLTITQPQVILKPIGATLAVGTVVKSNAIVGADIITTHKFLAQHTDSGM